MKDAVPLKQNAERCDNDSIKNPKGMTSNNVELLISIIGKKHYEDFN